MLGVRLPWYNSVDPRLGRRQIGRGGNDDCQVKRTFLAVWKSLDDVPSLYREAFSQAILFLLPMTDVERQNVYMMGGIPLELAAHYLLGKEPHLVKDVDMSFRPSAALMASGEFDGYIQELGGRMKSMFGHDLIAKEGDFGGVNPPTSQFKMNARALQNTDSGKVNAAVMQQIGQGWSAEKLMSFLKDKMEDVDFIPLVDGSVIPPVVIQNLCTDAQRRDFTINAMYLEMKFDPRHGVLVYLLDPTGLGMDDMKARVLRTPEDPGVTFWNDPRRLTRIFKMAHKMLNLFGGYTLEAGLRSYICDTRSVSEVKSVGDEVHSISRVVVEKLEDLKEGKMYQRGAIQADVIKVLGSSRYSEIARDLLRCPYLLRAWVAPGVMVSLSDAVEVSRQVHDLCTHVPDFGDLLSYHGHLHKKKRTEVHPKVDAKLYHQYLTLYQSWVTLLCSYVVLSREWTGNSGLSFGDFALVWLPSEAPMEGKDFLDLLCGERGRSLQGQSLWAGLISLSHVMLYDSANFDRRMLQGVMLDGMSKQAAKWYRNRGFNYMGDPAELQCFRYQLAELFSHVLVRLRALNPDDPRLFVLSDGYFDELYGILESYRRMIPETKNKETMSRLKNQVSLHLNSHAHQLSRLRRRE